MAVAEYQDETTGTADTGMPDSISAVVQNGYGPPSTLSTEQLQTPQPAAGEVLIRVEAAGMDRGVWHLVAGLPKIVRLERLTGPFPRTPGFDVAGTVVATGPGDSRFTVGDEVYGIGKGTFAEYAVAPEGKLIGKPRSMSWEEAGAATISGLTAFEAVHVKGEVQAGQQVLVLGASGGVGSFAVQMCAAVGATVVGVASAAKTDLVRSLGATESLDYRAGPLAKITAGHGPFDLIVDLGGNHPTKLLRSLLTDRGKLVLVGGEGGGEITGGFGRGIRAAMLSPFVSHSLLMVLSTEKPELIAQFGALMATGDITTSVGHTYGLLDAVAALEDLEAGLICGKAVLRRSTS